MSQYLMAIDQGTTSSRAIVFTRNGVIKAVCQQEFRQIFPADGWVEHDANEIWQSVLQVCRQVLQQAQLKAADIAAIGITNQRETTVIWDKKTGEPIHNAIVWQDRRTADFCQGLKNQGLEADVNAKTGLLIDPYFSGTKIRWILDNVPGARARAEKGELAFGTIDTFLLWKLTAGREHKTDVTNASRTLLMNLHTLKWDESLLQMLDVPAALLPQIVPSSCNFGKTEADLLGGEILIGGMAGDQQAALIGQACFKPGMAKSTYGTGCFLMVNTGDKPLLSQNRLLTTVAYQVGDTVHYAVEGSIFVAGAAVQWLRDGLKLIHNARETETMAQQVGVDNPVYLVPAFTGLGAPYWDPHARGAIFGLTRDTGIADIVTAGVQAVCYQTRDLLGAMAADNAHFSNLRVDGGMVVNNWLVQFLADICQLPIDRPAITETTALGAAYLAGIAAGVYKNFDEVAHLWEKERHFDVKMPRTKADGLYSGWQQAVERVRSGH
ncbi:MAG: glycerol kinase GlpK [Oceanospirillaceae bacterium]|nr:glycerol kinase GlpK [Oceanospirillaceae bacterium]MCP5335911.1 glycerol kinase GlpK [Oceanospirillaceae bacterium]MCP5351052.1 glycerol kinase GlpK [Oceanospirillaceae bacterium]